MTTAGAEAPLKAQVLRYIRANVDVPVEGAGVKTATIAEAFSLSLADAVALCDELMTDLEIFREPGVDVAVAKVFPA